MSEEGFKGNNDERYTGGWYTLALLNQEEYSGLQGEIYEEDTSKYRVKKVEPKYARSLTIKKVAQENYDFWKKVGISIRNPEIYDLLSPLTLDYQEIQREKELIEMETEKAKKALENLKELYDIVEKLRPDTWENIPSEFTYFNELRWLYRKIFSNHDVSLMWLVEGSSSGRNMRYEDSDINVQFFLKYLGMKAVALSYPKTKYRQRDDGEYGYLKGDTVGEDFKRYTEILERVRDGSLIAYAEALTPEKFVPEFVSLIENEQDKSKKKVLNEMLPQLVYTAVKMQSMDNAAEKDSFRSNILKVLNLQGGILKELAKFRFKFDGLKEMESKTLKVDIRDETKIEKNIQILENILKGLKGTTTNIDLSQSEALFEGLAVADFPESPKTLKSAAFAWTYYVCILTLYVMVHSALIIDGYAKQKKDRSLPKSLYLAAVSTLTTTIIVLLLESRRFLSRKSDVLNVLDIILDRVNPWIFGLMWLWNFVLSTWAVIQTAGTKTQKAVQITGALGMTFGLVGTLIVVIFWFYVKSSVRLNISF